MYITSEQYAFSLGHLGPYFEWLHLFIKSSYMAKLTGFPVFPFRPFNPYKNVNLHSNYNYNN